MYTLTLQYRGGTRVRSSPSIDAEHIGAILMGKNPGDRIKACKKVVDPTTGCEWYRLVPETTMHEWGGINETRLTAESEGWVFAAQSDVTNFAVTTADDDLDRGVIGMAVPQLQYLCTQYGVDAHGTKHELIVRLESVDISTEKIGMPGTLALRKCVNGMHEGAQKMIASKFAKGTLASPSIATAGGKLAFIYSIGFANFGGREVIIRGVHVSLMQNMSNTLHFLHERQKSGHPLLENQKVGDRNINYIVRVPDSNEAAMLKASMMNMASRTFGPENFDIVELIPHLAASKVNPDYHSTRDWIEPPHFGNIKACERCAKLSTMKGIRIKSCSSCHMVYFCSKECQRISWKMYHKNDCKAYALRAKGQQEECGQMKEIPKEVLKQNKKEEKQWKKKKEKEKVEELHNRDDEEYGAWCGSRVDTEGS